MKINRVPATSDFTQIPNAVLRDTRLSWKARGLLAYLLSHTEEGFQIDADRLVSQGKDGRHSILAGLKELVEYGYVVRTKRRDEQGHWHTDVEVYDRPNDGSPTSENRTSDALAKPQVAPDDGFPTSGNPTSGNPTVGKPAAKEEHQPEHQEEQEVRRPAKKRGERISDDFGITAEMRAWAAQHTPSIDDLGLQKIRFVNWWADAADAGRKDAFKTEIGWRRAWENWLIKAVKIQAEGNTRRPPAATAARNGHQPYRNPTDNSGYYEAL